MGKSDSGDLRIATTDSSNQFRPKLPELRDSALIERQDSP